MAFIVLLLYTKLISVKYIGVISAMLLVFLLLVYLLVRKARKKIRFIIGVVLSVLILAVLGTGSLYIYKTVSTLDTITGVNKDITKINVYVKEDDPAQKLADASAGIVHIFLSFSVMSGRSDVKIARRCGVIRPAICGGMLERIMIGSIMRLLAFLI